MHVLVLNYSKIVYKRLWFGDKLGSSGIWSDTFWDYNFEEGHTEQRRTRRFYITAIVRHRGTVGAWRNRGDLRVLLIFLFTSLQSSGLQDFLKRLLPKLSATRTLRLCRSLCLRPLREIVCFHLRVLPLSVWHLYVVGLIYHSIFRKNQFFSCFFFEFNHILLSFSFCKYNSLRWYLQESKWKSSKWLLTCCCIVIRFSI